MAGAFEVVMSERKALVDKIIGMMQQGYFFNKEEWNRASLRPQNPLSNVKYKGGNRLRLMAMVIENGYTDPRWATARQYQLPDSIPRKAISSRRENTEFSAKNGFSRSRRKSRTRMAMRPLRLCPWTSLKSHISESSMRNRSRTFRNSAKENMRNRTWTG